MNAIDIGIIAVLGMAFLIGFKNGFVKTTFSLLAWIVGIYASILYGHEVSLFLKKWISWNDDVVRFLAYILVFVLIVILFNLLSKLVTHALSVMMMGPLNKIGGGVFNVLKYVLILSFLILIVNSGNTYRILSESQRESSKFYEPLAAIAPALFPSIQNSLKDFDSDWIPDMSDREIEEDTLLQQEDNYQITEDYEI